MKYIKYLKRKKYEVMLFKPYLVQKIKGYHGSCIIATDDYREAEFYYYMNINSLKEHGKRGDTIIWYRYAGWRVYEKGRYIQHADTD